MPTTRVRDIDIEWTRQGTGPTVIFVQGVGATGRAWEPQVSALSDAFDCVTFDNRGIGGTARGERPLTVATLAEDAVALADALGIRRAHWVGHSLGGVIVQKVALTKPERVRSAAFLNTFAGGKDLAGPPWRLMWYGALARFGARDVRRRSFARLVLPEEVIAALGEQAAVGLLEQTFGRSLADPPPIQRAQLAALRAYDERRELSKLSSIPCLVVAGRQDPIARVAGGRALAEGIRTARYVEHPGGHALPIYAADEVNALLRDHLARAGGT